MEYTLKDWVMEWLYTYKRILVKPSTFDGYVEYANNVTCEKLLTEISTADVQLMINALIEKGRSLSTIKHMLTVIRQSLRKAQALGLIDNLSCMENIELPRAHPKVVNGLSEAQAVLIFKNMNRSYYGDFFVALLLTGCRVGELIALRWVDVDFFNSCIYISNTDYNGELQSVKTAHGVRCLPIYGKLEDILKRRKRGDTKSERVFVNKLGNPIKYRTLLDDWHWFSEHIGIYNQVGLHTLRHTFAHMSLRAGVPVKVVSAWLGHADVRITLNIYDAVDSMDMKKAADTLNTVFTA